MGNRKLTDATIKKLPTPPASLDKKDRVRTVSRITYDSELKGFGVRVTSNGAIAFVLSYRTKSGRERRMTIGSFPEWSTAAARTEAAKLKRRIDLGEDPLSDIEAEREAPTVEKMCERFLEETKVRPGTLENYKGHITIDILPSMKRLKVSAVTHSDVDALHRRVTKRAPYAANRVVALLSRMFNLAIKWGWRAVADNPAKGIDRNPEHKRERYLDDDELERLETALAELEDQQAADIVRLLLLTGARRDEVLAMTWNQVDLEKGVWTKPHANTKQKRVHRVPLSRDAVEIIARQPRGTFAGDFVFPGAGQLGRREGIRRPWARVCKAAGLKGVRLHDLRHTNASILVSEGLSLPIIGRMLGHTKPDTTARYAHLADAPLRAAAEIAAASIKNPKPPKVVRITNR